MHLHAYVLPISSYTLSKSIIECFMSICAGFGNRNSDRDDPACPEEGDGIDMCQCKVNQLVFHLSDSSQPRN